jgi:hypothetical protein
MKRTLADMVNSLTAAITEERLQRESKPPPLLFKSFFQ